VTTPLDITIVSDVICPWCFVGTRRLSQVLESMSDVVEPRIAYHAFLLDAGVPPEGADLRERLRRKYQVDPELMFRRIEAAAHATGIPLDFTRIRRTPSTIPAHTLLRHARERGTQPALSDALFTAYFLEGQDIGDPAVLAALATPFGFDASEAARLVTNADELARTRDEAESAAQQGVRGVPYFVFGGKTGFSGAQAPEVYRAAITQALGGLRAENA
jgi:predicted DsbA family dithiol-disulfide isomerase